jgi:hypothetical protein
MNAPVEPLFSSRHPATLEKSAATLLNKTRVIAGWFFQHSILIFNITIQQQQQPETNKPTSTIPYENGVVFCTLFHSIDYDKMTIN